MNHRSTIYAGEHPAIVDPAVFEAVGERLRENGLTDGKEVRNKYGALLRGLLHCDACDMTMVQTYTVKQKQVTAEAALDRSYLHDLAAGGRLDRGAVERLLAAMQEFSAPVKPEVLGVLGEAHFREWLARGKDAGSFRYKRLTGFEEDGLPYVVECAFVITDHFWLKGTHIGINWTVPLNNPVQNNAFVKAAHETV